MCFSATASFSAGAVLAAVGVVSLVKARWHREALTFAVIPLLFAVQQVIEGCLWISLTNDSAWVPILTYSYLTFAELVWPVCIPFAMLCLEREPVRIYTMRVLVGLGALLSLFLAGSLVLHGANADISGHHIRYTGGFLEHFVMLTSVSYGLTTVGSVLISSVRKMWILAVMIACSYACSAYFFEQHSLSVWCFFSALMSVMVVYLVSSLNRGPATGTAVSSRLGMNRPHHLPL